MLLLCGGLAGQRIEVKADKARTRAEVSIDGRLFTALRWDEKIRRPVLYPVMSPGGNFVTRGFPVETRDNEAIGHPHQVGASLVYGDVNGIDFWNNSPFRSAAELQKMGTIVLKEILSTRGGNGHGSLTTKSEWIGPDGTVLLRETTKYDFYAKGDRRWIDRHTLLSPVSGDVTFGDNKEGFFAIHLNTQLQSADQAAAKITTAAGAISDRTSAAGLTGSYFTSEGLTGASLWGTPAKWAAVTGIINGEPVTVALFDWSGNHNFPSNMMVRPYGLLALNPFGQKAFSSERPERKFVLKKGRILAFRHRLLISAGSLTPREIESEFQKVASSS
ncbi:MAG: PmoA family protein [Pyrinomonadaceae bacterium]